MNIYDFKVWNFGSGTPWHSGPTSPGDQHRFSLVLFGVESVGEKKILRILFEKCAHLILNLPAPSAMG